VDTSIDLSELAKLNPQIESLKLKPEQLNQAGQGIRLIVQADVDRRFAESPSTETGGEVWGGEYWNPLGAKYLQDRPERLGGQILRDTGELQQSFTAEAYRVYQVDGEELTFGTALPKAGRLHRDRSLIFWHPVLLEQVAEYLALWLEV
jgi:hypothetical protein